MRRAVSSLGCALGLLALPACHDDGLQSYDYNLAGSWIVQVEAAQDRPPSCTNPDSPEILVLDPGGAIGLGELASRQDVAIVIEQVGNAFTMQAIEVGYPPNHAVPAHGPEPVRRFTLEGTVDGTRVEALLTLDVEATANAGLHVSAHGSETLVGEIVTAREIVLHSDGLTFDPPSDGLIVSIDACALRPLTYRVWVDRSSTFQTWP